MVFMMGAGGERGMENGGELRAGRGDFKSNRILRTHHSTERFCALTATDDQGEILGEMGLFALLNHTYQPPNLPTYLPTYLPT